MTERVKKLKELLQSRTYRQQRCDETPDFTDDMRDLTYYMRFPMYLKKMLALEKPLLFEGDIFGFNRYLSKTAVCQDGDTELFPNLVNGNVTPNYMLLIDRGFLAAEADYTTRAQTAQNDTQRELYLSAAAVLKEMTAYCDRYREAAKQASNRRLYDALGNVPRHQPTSFYEACLFQKILIYLLRITNHQHMTLGRFDQYMYPYFRADVEKGVPEAELLETLELYFLTLNMDADTYRGVQTGDNGQSMVLGGYDAQGNEMFNDLSRLCMEASLELEVIDPKINLRVSRKTPDALYELGTRLTKKGLGFPQYCNDDVVVPGLVKLGYAPEDAWDYAVAACWEFTIPGKGMDVPNITTMNFPLVISNAIREHLTDSPDFETLMGYVKKGIGENVDTLVEEWYGRDKVDGIKYNRTPILSMLMDGCMESGMDAACHGAKYYNFGSHGAGISCAADALAAVKKMVYDDKAITAQVLLKALEDNFEGHTALRNQLLSCPKMGNNDDYVDSIAIQLMQTFVDDLNGRPNGIGGIWRAGTGSAMEYILSAKRCPATPDGRKDGEPYGCSYSPSIQAKLDGPLSVVQSFTKFDLSNIINGGPLTIEIHDNVFRNAEGEKKVAALVKLFVLSGGHQLQLNSVNREKLLDAQKHPENYPNLVVRVWGWSGYFCELDLAYQNHIISRTNFTV